MAHGPPEWPVSGRRAFVLAGLIAAGLLAAAPASTIEECVWVRA